MPNLIQIAEHLKGAPDAYLQREAQSPTGAAPPYLVLGEIQRRQTMRQAGEGGEPPMGTVYDDLLRQPRGNQPGGQGLPGLPPQAGMPPPTPQMGAPGQPGLGAFAQMPERAMPAPPMGYGQALHSGIGALAARTPPLRMYQGGLIRRMYQGGPVDDAVWEEMNRRQAAVRTPVGMAALTSPMGSAPSTLDLGGYFAGLAGQGGYSTDTFNPGDQRNVAAGDTSVTVTAGPGGDCPPGWDYNANTNECIRPAFTRVAIPELPKYPEVAPVTFDQAQKELAGKYPKLDTAAFERRLDQLSAQRADIKEPTGWEAMVKAGLGIMGSRSPYASVAIGEGGLAAMKDWESRKDLIRKERHDLDDKIAAADLARTNALHSGRVEEFKAANDIYQRLLVNRGIELQTSGQRYSTEANANLQRAIALQGQEKDIAAAEQARYDRFRIPWADSTLGIAAEAEKQKKIAEGKLPSELTLQEKRNQGGWGLAALRRSDRVPQQGDIQSAAEYILSEQFERAMACDPVGTASASQLLDRARDRAVELIVRHGVWSENYTPEELQRILQAIGARRSNLSRQDKANFEERWSIERDRRKASPATTAPATGAAGASGATGPFSRPGALGPSGPRDRTFVPRG